VHDRVSPTHQPRKHPLRDKTLIASHDGNVKHRSLQDGICQALPYTNGKKQNNRDTF